MSSPRDANESAARVPQTTRRFAQRCRTARLGRSLLSDRMEDADEEFAEIGRLRLVLAQAFPVDVVLLLGTLADFRQRVEAVLQSPELHREAAEMLSASLGRLQGVIEQIRTLASNSDPDRGPVAS